MSARRRASRARADAGLRSRSRRVAREETLQLGTRGERFEVGLRLGRELGLQPRQLRAPRFEGPELLSRTQQPALGPLLALEERLEVRRRRERGIEGDLDDLAAREIPRLGAARAGRHGRDHALQQLAEAAELRRALALGDVADDELLLLGEGAALLLEGARQALSQSLRLRPDLLARVVRLDRREERLVRQRGEAILAGRRRAALRRQPGRAPREVATRLLEGPQRDEQPLLAVEEVHVAARTEQLEQQLEAPFPRVEEQGEDAIAAPQPGLGEPRAAEVRAQVLGEGRRARRRGLGRLAERDPRRARPAGEQQHAAREGRAAAEPQLELEGLALHGALEARAAEARRQRARGALELAKTQHGSPPAHRF